MRRFVPNLIAFVLPLGFWGGLALVAAAAHTVVRWRVVGSLGWAPIAASAPYAIALIASSALNGSSPQAVLHAFGFALLVTLGLQAARTVLAVTDANQVVASLLLGTSVLAGSVVADFVLGWNRLPSGLFVDPALHNWVVALFALAFPLGMHLAARSGRLRTVGVIGALSCVIGSVAALSWVGVIALALSAFVYGVSTLPWLRWAALALVGVAVLSHAVGWGHSLDVRGFSVQEVERSVRYRLAMYQVGIGLGWQRPWLGWGSPSVNGELASIEGLVEAGRVLERRRDAGGNLLAASEDLTALAWSAWHARVSRADVDNPTGAKGTSLSMGAGVPGQRVYQYVRSAGSDETFTFSVWVRSDHGPRTVALSVRHRDGGVDTVRELTAEHAIGVVGLRAARFVVDEAWRRLSVTSRFDRAPDGLLAMIYLDGFYAGDQRTEPVEVWGAQLEVGEVASTYQQTGVTSPMVRLEALSHFHNWYLQTFVQHGVPGLIALAGWLCWSLLSMRGTWGVPARAAAVGFLTTQAFDLATHQASITFAFLLVIALGVHRCSETERSSVRTDATGCQSL